MKAGLILVNGLVAGVLAAPLADTSVVHEKRDVDNSNIWVKREAVAADSRIPVRIALKQRNLDKGYEHLINVSDPKSPNYGKYYSQEQIVDLFAPGEDSVAAVKKWLIDSGIPADSITIPKSKGWIQFESTASKLESVLHTKYHTYDHTQSNSVHVGTDEYSLPTDVSELVDFITPGVVFAQHKGAVLKRSINASSSPKHKLKPIPAEVAQALAAKPEDAQQCGSYVTPACIKDIYNLPNATKAADGNKLAIFEVDGEYYVKKDLDQFFAYHFPAIKNGTYPTPNLIDGAQSDAPQNSDNVEGEADLDFQTAWPIIYPQGTILYEASVQKDDLLNTFLDAIDGSYCTSTAYGETGDDPKIDGKTKNEQCGVYSPANVISISYGEAEADLPVNYQKRQCDEFLKLGLQGSTVFVSSGDDGVARRSGWCLGPKQNIFTPGYPAACPYLTSVGATSLPDDGKPGDQEVASTDFSSGGGFSNIYLRPSYQNATVSDYFTNSDPGYKSYNTSDGKIPITGGIYNRAGRGYPDLSAIGQNGVFVVKGKNITTGGTSMSAPLVAGIFNLINEERLAIGKGPIGFINPTIYSHPEAFKDVVTGDQSLGGPQFFGDGQPSACGNSGFHATNGWDPVTGLGTPIYSKLLDIFLTQ